MANKRYVSYDDMNAMLNKMYRDMAIEGYKPDVVVGLTRGGLIPAVHFSHYFDVPMVAFKYSLRDHPGTDPIEKLIELTGQYANILIVDDICDEGHTLHEIFEAMKTAPGVVDPAGMGMMIEMFFKTAVLQHNLGATLFEPDYAGEEINKVEKPEWIVYPFEY
jgi:hypoxanthine phosphoribosyltransferase